MAGFTPDPAVEKWYKMRETTHLFFRPTPKHVIVGLTMFVAIPCALYTILESGSVL